MKIVHVSSSHGDWSAIYIEGKLDYQGHSIPSWLWLEYMTKGITETEDFEVDGDWLDGGGSFPEDIKDIPEQSLV